MTVIFCKNDCCVAVDNYVEIGDFSIFSRKKAVRVSFLKKTDLQDELQK